MNEGTKNKLWISWLSEKWALYRQNSLFGQSTKMEMVIGTLRLHLFSVFKVYADELFQLRA